MPRTGTILALSCIFSATQITRYRLPLQGVECSALGATQPRATIESLVRTQTGGAIATYVLIAIVKKTTSTRSLALHLSTDFVGLGL